MPANADRDGAVAALERYCEFGEDRVYLLVALARRKENPRPTGGSGVALREVAGNREDLRRAYDRLRGAARSYRTDAGDPLAFRLYVTANARNALDGYFEFRERMDGWVRDRLSGDTAARRKFQRLDEYWTSELQKPAVRDEKRFLFDLDGADEDDLQRFLATLEPQAAVLARRATPNGYHVVTERFDYTALEADVDYELKTDGLLFVERLTAPEDP